MPDNSLYMFIDCTIFAYLTLQVETHLVYCSLGCWKPCRHDCYDCDIIRTSRLVFPYRSLWSWIPGSLKHHFQREKLSILERVLQIYIPTYPTYIWNIYGVIFGEQLLFRVPSHFGTPKFSQKWAFLSAKVSISIMKTLLLNLGPMGRKSPKFHPSVISKKPLVLFRVPDYETYASSFVHDSSERVEILGKTNQKAAFGNSFLLGIYGCFRKWWYPTTIGSPTKNDHFGVFWEYPYFRKHPYIYIYMYIYIYVINLGQLGSSLPGVDQIGFPPPFP